MMELGVNQLIVWVANLLLIASAFYVVARFHYHGPDRQTYQQKSSSLATSSGLREGNGTKPSILLRVRRFFRFEVCIFTLLVASVQSAIPLMIEAVSPEVSNEFALDKRGERGSDTASLTEPLLKGLGYEFEGRLEMALAAYREAYENPKLTEEARAFLLNRIARIRFEQGFAEEALQEARFAIDLGGPQPIYLHTHAKILIHECLLDDAKEQLRRVKDRNVITEELLASIAGRRVDCQQS